MEEPHPCRNYHDLYHIVLGEDAVESTPSANATRIG